MKLNFKRFEVFVDAEMQQCIVQDTREAVSDLIYRNGTGVRSLDLSLRILRSEEDEEYSDEEVELISGLVERFGFPFFIVSIRHAIERMRQEEQIN